MHNLTPAAASSPLTVGFDIGGTNLRAGVVDAHGELIHSRSTPTPQEPEALDAAVVTVIEDLRQEFDIAAVGLAIAGFIDPQREIVRFAPHLPWVDAPVRANLQARVDIPVVIEHDANSAAWAEWRFGAGQGARDWVFMAVGTGIGATLITGESIYRGAFGTAPEFGHLVVVPGGRECSCGKHGCLERYASGTALPDTFRELRGKFPDSTLGVDAKGADIAQAAREGDPLGVAVMEDFAQWLGQGLSIVADVLDPELIVLGGGVAGDADIYLDTAAQTMARSIVGAGHRPVARVVTAKLGSAAGMIGVADLARTVASG
ncbi:glucokinase [Corynebacterium phocae]|uniref:Glucokinase n=1 Tax=Corynebacterium phocae TaxID=161895 RepID=A0A1L7D249_9CORY|nr:ROK family protein [Corynebacterium phocae]APT92209.1 glucokinase [Corynebacterium phocae]KAA8725789.1 ROK family protein [Corynebacterium phocae]